MTPEFSQDFQDTRTWVLETLIRHEGCLDSRMYACADRCVSSDCINDVKDVVKTWEDFKKRIPSTSSVNRL